VLNFHSMAKQKTNAILCYSKVRSHRCRSLDRWSLIPELRHLETSNSLKYTKMSAFECEVALGFHPGRRHLETSNSLNYTKMSAFECAITLLGIHAGLI
jgi:hypothetical protein